MDGVILVNKPEGWTSRDVINKLNSILNTKRIGHTGTLDPIATGILVVMVGKYTKCTNLLSNYSKEYIAKIKLGIKTDTLDITGNILEKGKANVKKEDIVNVLKSLEGSFKQKIPLYAAKKINGRKLYEYARKGIPIERPENEVEIFSLELLDYENDMITFKAIVSKGTYIRSLIESICEKLNVLGTMSSLERTKQGVYSLDNASSLEDIENGNYKLLTAKDLFIFKQVQLSDNEYLKVKNGNSIVLNETDDYIILIYKNREIAVYHKKDNCYKPEVMLY